MKKRNKLILGSISLSFILIACVFYWASYPATITLPAKAVETRTATGSEVLLAGFGKADITPKGEVFLAGFSHNRKSTGVHDKLYARCVYIEKGDFKLALVSLDLLGGQYHRLEKIKKALKPKIDPSAVIIASTHTHSGPDTIGFYGTWLLSSGIDADYMNEVEKKTVEAIALAMQDRHPVVMRAGSAQVPDKTIKNIREAGVFDPELSVISFDLKNAPDIGPITLFNFAAHPEVLWDDNTKITADWPGYAISLIEKETGGDAIFFNGALGAMVTPDVKVDDKGDEVHTFEEAGRIGGIIGKTALEALQAAKITQSPVIGHSRRVIYIPIENRFYVFAKRAGLIERPVYMKNVETVVNAVRLGDAMIVTVPGEVYPKIWLSLKKKLNGRVLMVFSLADDELGYILYPEDRRKKLYSYERSMGPGDKAGPMIENQLEDLAKRLDRSGLSD